MNNIIVSLTSYPARINNVSKTIMSMMVQTMEPDEIELWLSQEEFPDGEDSLPDSLLKLRDGHFSIKWCSNLKPHKKYFYSMQEHKEDIIITVDDDVYYSPNVIEELYKSYTRFPDCVSCLIAHRIRFSDGAILPYEQWMKNDERFYGIPSHSLLATGVGGVLYPPGCLCDEVFNEKVIFEISLTTDDLWLKAMEVLSDVKVVLAGRNMPRIVTCKELQETGLYVTENKFGGNDRALQRIYKYLDRITGTENYFCKRVYDVTCDEKVLKIENKAFLKQIEDGVAIYGAGDGGKLMLKYIELLTEGKKKPKCFITSTEPDADNISGIPVYSVQSFMKRKELEGCAIIISVSQDKQPEIKGILKNIGYSNIYYIENMFFARMRTIKTEIDNMRQYVWKD